ncbi:MAG: AF1514 family protein [Gammaproteobacteria bacterium]|nr:AF1514 family protein [Gammaproteobacteria bacterium]
MSDDQISCDLNSEPDYSAVQIVEIDASEVQDYRQAMKLADEKAEELLGDYMLLSWYDRDRDFESPQHASECHQDSAIPGYVDYGIYHGAKLKIDIGQGRFVFFYLPIDV